MSDSLFMGSSTGHVRVGSPGARPVIAFDIGGTWFRSGIVAGGEIVSFSRRPAINFKSHANLAIGDLQSALADYVIDTVEAAQNERPDQSLNVVAVSMGAALNAHDGKILNAGPLWGPGCRVFDLAAVLRERRPGVDWVIVNDVTAALLAEVEELRTKDLLRVALLTVSSGIATRIFDFRTNGVPVDRVHGLQGEIGHLPIDFEISGRVVERFCECGGRNHLNAFCSGNGIGDVLPALAGADPNALSQSLLWMLCGAVAANLSIAHLAEAVRRGDVYAKSILDRVTLPLALMILQMFTIDPEIERLVLTGGVVASFGEHYRRSLLSHLDRLGLYQITAHDPGFFERRVALSALDGRANLVGAASVALQSTTLRQCVSRTGADRMSWIVAANSAVQYEVRECDDLFSENRSNVLHTDSWAKSTSNRRFVVIDAEVDRLHGERIRRYFERNGIDAGYLVMPSSEQGKVMAAVTTIADALSAFRLSRRAEPVIAIGGGIVLDIVGVAAALFRRSTPYIRVPTTLLALVDASVGVKTGVNHRSHKNLLGIYNPPLVTLIDRTFLRTLSQRHVRNGMAEMIKLGIIRDRDLFETLERNGPEFLRSHFQGEGEAAYAVRSSITIMLNELAPNLWDQMLDRAVDFGHSFSPILEMRAAPDELAHGEAVAIDMALCTVLAWRRAILTAEERDRVLRLFDALGLRLWHPLCTPEVLYESLERTIRHRDGSQRVPLPAGIGRAIFVNDISSADLADAASYLKGWN